MTDEVGEDTIHWTVSIRGAGTLIALFWGNESWCNSEIPVICEDPLKAGEELVLEKLRSYGSNFFSFSEKNPWFLPGMFFFFSIGEDEDPEGIKIGDLVDRIKKGGVRTFPAFLYFTGKYNRNSHKLIDIDQEGVALATEIASGSYAAKKQISLRLDGGLVLKLRNGRPNISTLFYSKIATIILNKYFSIGGIAQELREQPMLFARVDVNGIKDEVWVNNKRFWAGSGAGQDLIYLPTGKKELINTKTSERLSYALKKLAQQENRTVTSLIEEALVGEPS